MSAAEIVAGIETETFIPKSDWGPGPWQAEPDRVRWEWRGKKRFACWVNRVPHSGTLNGYVGVPPRHPLFGVLDDDLRFDVHGGLTYAGPSAELVGDGSDLWWFGFDTAHAWDVLPAMESLYPLELNAFRGAAIGWGPLRSTYRTVGYVTREVEKLARMLVQHAYRRVSKRLRNRRAAALARKLRRDLVRRAGDAARFEHSLSGLAEGMGYMAVRSAMRKAAKIGREVRVPRSFRREVT